MEDSGVKYVGVYDEGILKRIDNQFSRLKEECYLDHAGATLYSAKQINDVTAYLLSSLYANPHSAGLASGLTHDTVELIRYRVLQHFHTTSEEYSVIFTSGATAALKTVAEVFNFSQGTFAYTQDNHTSVLGMRELASKKGAKIHCLHNDSLPQHFENPKKQKSSQTRDLRNSLFVYSAQCNFSGLKNPLRWIAQAQNGALGDAGKWHVLLDAASFVATNDLDLSIYKPDFVTISFYKMFGYPTGIGALIVKNSSAQVLEKEYYGGGTVKISLSSDMTHVKKEILHERFEDGTISFLSIITLQQGLEALSELTMPKISKHVFFLAQYLYLSLKSLRHFNDSPVIKLYSDTNYKDPKTQGGIVTFNVLRSNGEYVGYMEVLNMASMHKIHLRTGCFCNPGACQRHLELMNEELLSNYDSGYVCGGDKDLINGKPTGAVRISFGYMSKVEHAQAVVIMMEKCFVEKRRLNGVRKVPEVEESEGNLRLRRLFVYPVKSCGAFEVRDSWRLNEKGLEYDREWMIVNSADVCLTQKHVVKMCLIRPRICLERRELILSYPGMPDISVPLSLGLSNGFEGKMCLGKVCGHKVEGTDCGTDVSEWLSLALGKPRLRLVRQNEVKGDSTKPKLSFASQAQYLLINEASILWLRNKVPEDADVNKDTILHRFRGNIVVSGAPAFGETQWNQVKIGEHEFKVEGPCTRCQMICIDQTTSEKTVEPLRSLASELHGKIRFGIYLSRMSTGSIRFEIGDTLQYF